ncbi:MAG TPA: MlaD family protein [Thermoanaerobaculia bacterium]|nr:MlaD family protein [Thermoanaerobaculia bacterium]
MNKTERQFARYIRIGLLVAVSLLILMVTLFFIGSEQKIFSKKHEYYVHFESASGLAEGNPVRLSGVTVGVVRDIRLPRDPEERSVVIALMVDRKFSERIRLDSRARLKKLGLLAGDSYIDVTPGSPRFPAIEPGNIIPAQKATNVDQLISSGEDLVDNFVQISYSLKNVLERVDRGEGLLGELTKSPDKKERITDTLVTTLSKTNEVLTEIQHGDGVLGKIIYDKEYAASLTGSLESSAQSLQAIMANVQRGFESGEGALPALLHDPEGKGKVIALLENLRVTSERLALFTASLETGEGLVPRLLNDKEFGDETLREFRHLVQQLNEMATKLNEGEGTAGKLISDPAIYESINDVLIGINESRLLRWLVRSRQQRGIERRYETERSRDTAPPASGPRKPAATPARTQASSSAAIDPPPPEVAVIPPAAEMPVETPLPEAGSAPAVEEEEANPEGRGEQESAEDEPQADPPPQVY